MFDVEKIRSAFRSNFVFYTTHSREKMESEEFGIISDAEIFEAVLSAEIIEEYPNDRPYPSCLLLGTTSTKKCIKRNRKSVTLSRINYGL